MRLPTLALFACFVLVLAACTPVESNAPVPQSDNPIMQIAVAKANEQIAAQEKADQEAAAKQAELQAEKKTQREIELIMAPVRAKQTETALEIQKSQFEIDKAKQELELKEKQRQDALAELEAQKTRVETQIEIAKKQREADNKNTFDWLWARISPFAYFAVLCFAGYALYVIPNEIQKAINRRKDRQQEHDQEMEKREKSVMLLTDGKTSLPVWVDPKTGRPEIIGPPKKVYPDLSKDATGIWGSGKPVQVVEPSTNIFNAAPTASAPDDPNTEVYNFVCDAIRLKGRNGDQIPTDSDMGIGSYKWQRLTGLMEQLDLLEKTGEGTFLKDTDGPLATLGGVGDALRSGRLIIPSPKKERHPRHSPTLPVAGD